MTQTPFTMLLALFGACSFGFPVSEDVALFSAGLLVSAKTFELPVVFVVAWSAIVCGDSTQFFIGRLIGPRIFERPWMQRLVDSNRRMALETRLRRWGPFACFGARFLPGARIPMYVLAGASGVRPLPFLTLDGLAATISVSFWLFTGGRIGEHARGLVDLLANRGQVLVIGAAVVAAGVLAWRALRQRYLRSHRCCSDIRRSQEFP